MRAWMPLLLSLCAPAAAALPGGLSGAWYNPAQSGHGLSVEVLTDESALIFWYTYDKSGAPLTLYTEGRIEGRSIVGPTLAPSGMRFGEFRRDDLVVRPWGAMRIDFVDCDHANFSFDALDENYGEGAFPIRRLTRIKDSSCALVFPARLDTGVYKLRSDASVEWHVAVDGEGRMFGVSTARDADGTPSQPAEVTNAPATLILGTPAPVDAASAIARYEIKAQAVTWQLYGGGVAGASGTISIDADGQGDAVRIPQPGGAASLFDFDGRETARHLAPDLSLADLAGTGGSP